MKTDIQLKQDVIDELQWEPSVEAAQIGVEVKDGVVTLAGHVGSFAEKWNAEKAVQRVYGVRALAIEIDVELAGSSIRTDGDIARSADNVLIWTTSVPRDTVKVKVESGWVTLSGTVEWEFQRQAATDAVRYLMGVKGVTDLLAIRSTVSASNVKSGIEAALRRRASDDAGKISVDVHGGDVTLSGTVNSWSERELAANSAWGASGVRKVVDNMKLTF
jgi:osmotically-inducible protein OsmY